MRIAERELTMSHALAGTAGAFVGFVVAGAVGVLAVTKTGAGLGGCGGRGPEAHLAGECCGKGEGGGCEGGGG